MKKDLKEACEKAGGKMENGYCDVKKNEKYVEESPKKECKKANGDWKNGECNFL